MDIKSAIEPILKQVSLSSQDYFINVIQKVGKVITNYSNITVTGVSYSGKQLSLVMTASDSEVFNKFVSDCSSAGLKVVNDNMTPKDKITVLNLTVEGA